MGFTVESDPLPEDDSGSSQNQEISQEQVTSSPSPDQPKAELDLDAVFADPRMEKLAQRFSDKSVSKVEKELANVAGRLDRYEKYREAGMTPEQAKRELEIDALLGKQSETVSTEDKSDLSKEVQPMATLNISQALKDAGYDPATATREDIEFAMKYTNQVEAANELLKRRVNQPPPTEPDPSTVVPQTGKATQPVDKIALLAELEELTEGDTNRERQEEIKAMLVQEGIFEGD
jgi:hypothetical protein